MKNNHILGSKNNYQVATWTYFKTCTNNFVWYIFLTNSSFKKENILRISWYQVIGKQYSSNLLSPLVMRGHGNLRPLSPVWLPNNETPHGAVHRLTYAIHHSVGGASAPALLRSALKSTRQAVGNVPSYDSNIIAQNFQKNTSSSSQSWWTIFTL